MPLTKRQKEVLDFLDASISRNGYAPSLQEIGDALGMHALATVHKHLENLREKGWITRAFNRSRQLALAAPDGCCPTCGQAMPVSAEAQAL